MKTGQKPTIKQVMDEQLFSIWQLIFKNRLEKTHGLINCHGTLEAMASECMTIAKHIHYTLTE